MDEYTILWPFGEQFSCVSNLLVDVSRETWPLFWGCGVAEYSDVLIIGSGNMVHNLGMVAWDKLNAVDYAYDWAREASEKMNRFILEGDHQSLVKFRSQGKAFELAIPTPEHFLPLLYTLALKDEKDEVSLFNDKAVAGSLTMTSVRIG